MIRSIWAWANIAVATAFCGTVAIVAAIFRVRGGIYDWCTRTWARWVLRTTGVKVITEGLDRVNLEHAQIFVSNHVSWYDVFALAAVLPKRYRFVAKKELEKIPLFGTAWKAAGHISVDRGDRKSAIRSLDQAGETIRRDHSSVIMFPEGTRSATGELQPFKKGAFMLALHTGVEVVPVAVIGSGAVLPKGSWRVTPRPLIVRFGAAIDPAAFASDRDRLVDATQDEVRRLLDAAPGR